MIIEFFAAAITILGALYALEAKELMRGILGLAVFFLGISVFFGLLGAWFLAVGQIFLFVGGVVTLFVLAFTFLPTPRQEQRFLPAFLLALGVFVVLFAFLPQGTASAAVPLSVFAHDFFTTYGGVLNIALLVLFAAVLSAQYVMTEDNA